MIYKDLIKEFPEVLDWGILLDSEIHWGYISKHRKLSEKFIEKYKKYIDWEYISIYQTLSEKFIEKYKKYVSWLHIVENQILSESFIEKHEKSLDGYMISVHQKLSEKFIEKHKKSLHRYMISVHQKLSEKFIEKHMKYLDIINICIYHRLSEKFIAKHKKHVFWRHISKYQKLSENFIKKYFTYMESYIPSLLRYQKLSEKFRKTLEIMSGTKVKKDNWLYWTKKQKLDYIKKHKIDEIYELIDDKYIIAYKGVRKDYYSKFNFQYKFEIGGIYEAHCDCAEDDYSFGLSAWTKEGALSYYSGGRLLKVKVRIEDIGRIVRRGNKLRCHRLEILEEIEK